MNIFGNCVGILVETYNFINNTCMSVERPWILVHDFTHKLLPLMVPTSYVACSNENEPTLFDRFFVAQNVSASLHVFDRRLDATTSLIITGSEEP